MFYSFLILVLLVLLYFKSTRNKYSHLPTLPYFVPWLGNLPLLFDKGDPLNHQARLYRKYSKGGLLYFHIVGLDHILVGDFQVVKYLFNHPNFANRGHAQLDKNLMHKKTGFDRKFDMQRNSPGIIISHGLTWTQQRRFMLRTLRDFGFGKSSTEEVVRIEVKRFLNFLQTKQNSSFLVHGCFNLPILNILWSFCAGEQYEYDDPRLVNLLKHIYELFKVADSGRAETLLHVTLPTWIFKLFPNLLGRNIAVDTHAKIRNFLERIIKDHESNVNEDNPRDFIEAYLSEISKTTDPDSSFFGSYGRKNLLETQVDLLLAGAETTSTTLTWAMLYIIRNPDVQAKVQKELDSVIGRDCLPLYSDRLKLPYTEAVIMEIQRCGNIAPLAIFHFNSEDVEVNGMTIPANTMVSPLMSEILKGDHWGQDKKVFRPDRFLDDSGEIIQDEHLIPFSIGKRRCPGEALARIELFQFFTGILQNFNILPEDVDSLPTEDYIMGITISPKHFNCIFQPR